MSQRRIDIERDRRPKSEDDFFSNFEGNQKKVENEKNAKKDASESIRQTFILRKDHLEKLKDYVHTRRINGDTNYTQKQALQDALELLFESVSVIRSRINKD